jgi:hypothetical protein
MFDWSRFAQPAYAFHMTLHARATPKTFRFGFKDAMLADK